MKTRIAWLAAGLLILVVTHGTAAPPTTSPFIKVDQFGYLPASRKVAVISNPKRGFNADQSFSPVTGTNRYQVRRWDDHAVVFRGTLSAWNAQQVHLQSGDQGWWFDFSEVTQPGSYYVYDTKNEVGSGRFEISEEVYDEVLEQAVRMFYYQRVNYAKQAPYAGAWTDGAAFEGPNQDRAATDVNNKGNAATARDLHGGWFDAGDLNKYTTFTFNPLTQMLEAYRMNPAVFRDDYNIPESGNGVADLLDEIKYELDWLTRMQDATGTDGLMLKVGMVTYDDVSPPSQDRQARYYLGECTSATIAGAAVFALGGLVYRSLPPSAWSAYGSALIARAERAWNRARVTTQDYTVFETECDSQEIRAGDADREAQEQRNQLLTAAVYLYEATGKPEYRTYVERQYAQVDAFIVGPSWPYDIGNSFALLHYTTLPDIGAEAARAIVNRKTESTPEHSPAEYQAETDLYRAHMEDRAHHWGSNFIRANSGNVLLDFNVFEVSDDPALYREAAEQYVHWLHGVNPLGLVMLSNMYDYGAERSVNEISHAWFDNGTPYDNAQGSPVGPAPGYLVGGPSKDYPVSSISPPYGQPPQKAYRDWNTGWNGNFDEESYRITEPGIYYQGSYVALLSRVIARGTAPPPSSPVADASTYVYQDALADGWQNWSWSADIDFDQTAVVRAGSRAMRITFQSSASAGVSLRSEQAINTDEYEAIQMQLHGGSGPDRQLRVYVQTQDDGNGSEVKTITVPANQWQRVTVSMRELGNPEVIKRITVEGQATDETEPFYLDEVRLVKKVPGLNTALTNAARVQVYPNALPRGTPLRLRWPDASSPRRVEVLNQRGQVLYQTTHAGRSLQIEHRHFRRAGLYLVRTYPLSSTKAETAETFRILVQ